MTTDYIYNPVAKLTVADRFARYCRNQWGVNAPEVVTVMAAALIIGAYLGLVVVVL